MHYGKIDHPSNYSFVASNRNPYAIGERVFDFRVTDLGDDVHRLEVRNRAWKGHDDLAPLNDAVFHGAEASRATASIPVRSVPAGSARVPEKRAAKGRTSSPRPVSERSSLRIDGAAELLLEAGGKLVLRSLSGQSFGVLGQKWLFQFQHRQEMRFYGMGEKSGPLERSGRRTLFWNTDLFADFTMHEIEQGDPDPLYVSIPYLLIRQPGSYVGILLDTPFPAFMASGAPAPALMGAPVPNASAASQGGSADGIVGGVEATGSELYLGAQDGPPTLYFLYGESAAEVTAKLQRLCGTTPLPPLWSLGHHQSRWGFRSFAELEEIGQGFRRNGIPNDGLWLDIDYMEGYRVFTIGRKGFAEPESHLAALKEAGQRVVAILDPGVKHERGYEVYEDASAKGLLCKNSEGRDYIGFAWPGQVAFPDFSLPETRSWWSSRVQDLAAKGFAGFWLDMNDPSTGTAPLDEMRFGRGKEPHESFHNEYALGMQIASRDGLAASAPDLRPFLLSRSASPGSSRYAAVWMGDNLSTFRHLAQSIPMALNLSLSGIPFVGADVPGFGGDADAAIAASWYKAAFLFPFLRNHSSISSRRQEPWSFGPRVTKVLAHYISLRYKLLPYLYNLFVDQEEAGTTILRPLFYEFEEDSSLATVEDQFMVGPSIMQAPIIREQRNSRKVRLPDARWWSAWDRRWLKGGREVTAVESARSTPIYFREGSIVPMQTGLRTTNENNLSEIELHLFVSERYDGISSYTYRFDDGETNGYREGRRSAVVFTVTRDRHNVIIDAKCIERGYGPLVVRFFVYGYFGSIILKRSEKDDELEALTLTSVPWYLAGTKVVPHASEPVTIG